MTLLAKIIMAVFGLLMAFGLFMPAPDAVHAAPPAKNIGITFDVAGPVAPNGGAYTVKPDLKQAQYKVAAAPVLTPVVFITQQQSDALIYDTFVLAASVFSSMISIIAMGAGIGLGFRIAREVRGFLTGGA
jgi:hypothetical protein